MKRLNRDMEAVSPVIATILMVAITVVLAATLYMMVGDIGGDDVQTLTGDITHNEHTEFEVVSISPNPSTEDVEITVLFEEEDQDDLTFDSEDWGDGDDPEGWSFLDDSEVQGGSRFDLEEIDDDPTGDGDTTWEDLSIDEVVIQVDGVDGTISYEM